MAHQNREQSQQHQHQKHSQQNRARFVVSGRELYLWRERAISQAIAKDIAIEEVDWLLREITDLDSLTLRLNSFQDRQIPLAVSLAELSQGWRQRIESNLPVQYVIGSVYWRNFKLTVTPAVLIPRPETELIVDFALEAAATCLATDEGAAHWVDLGTGSGAIALGLASNLPRATIHTVDCSQAALAVAQANADHYHLAERIKFYHGSWWQPLSDLKGRVRGMVSNPPYIPTEQLDSLQPEVAKHEPHLALDGGEDGLAAIRHLVDVAPDYLVPGGIWLVEMMAGQAAIVARMLEERGSYHRIKILSDLAGIDRFALAYRR